MNLTGLLISYGREHILLKQIQNISSFPFKILILDGSPIPNLAAVEEIKSFNNFQYLHIPTELLSQRYLKVIDTIKTDYVIIIPDDDLMLLDSIKTCLSFLELNHDYVASLGFYVDKVTFDLEKYSPSLDQSNASERLAFHCRHFASTYYCVQRTAAFKTSVLNSANFPQNSTFWELTFNFTLTALGKIRCFPFPMLLRSQNTPEYINARFTGVTSFYIAKDPEGFAESERQFLATLGSCPPFDTGNLALERAYRSYLIGERPGDDANNIMKENKYLICTMAPIVGERTIIDRLADMDLNERMKLCALEDTFKQFTLNSPHWRGRQAASE